MKEQVTIGLLDRRGGMFSPREWLRVLLRDLAGLWENRFALGYLVGARLKVRYQRSALGFVWALLTPILMLIVLSIVFGHVIGRNIPRFPVYLFTGLVPFKFFSGAIQVGCKSLVSQQRIITRFNVQRMVLPLADILFAFVDMLFEMVALFLVLTVVGAKLSGSVIVLPAALAFLVLFTTGMVFIAMTVVTYFRDVEHIISVIMRALYFATPIILRPEMLHQYAVVMYSNPLTYIIGFFRSALYDGTWPTGTAWIVASISSVASLIVGYIVYKRYEHDYVFRI